MASAGLALRHTHPAAGVLAGVGRWWEGRAEAAGLSGRWLDVHWAVAAQAPQLDYAAEDAAVLAGTAEQVGQAYVLTLPGAERSMHGRHYTPEPLAAELWSLTKRAMGWKRPQPPRRP